jgi:hypothetical protein
MQRSSRWTGTPAPMRHNSANGNGETYCAHVGSPSKTTVAEQSEIYLTQVCGGGSHPGVESGPAATPAAFCAILLRQTSPLSKRLLILCLALTHLQASLNVQSNVPEGTRVVLLCKYGGRSTVLCHFRVGVISCACAFVVGTWSRSRRHSDCVCREPGDCAACLNRTCRARISNPEASDPRN